MLRDRKIRTSATMEWSIYSEGVNAMLILIFLALCAIGGFPWWAYVGGIAVWLFATDWSN